MNSNTNKRDYWKTLILLVFSAQILSLVPSLIFYLLNISAGTTTEPASLISGLLLFIVPNLLWLYYVFSHILQAFDLPNTQEIFKQINKYRKHFQVFYLPFSIAIIPVATIINRRILIPNEDLEVLFENVLNNIAIPSVFFVPSYIFLEYVLDRIISPKLSENLDSGDLHLFTTLSVLQKYMLISIFMVIGTFFFMLNTLLPDFRALDGIQIVVMILIVFVPIISLHTYYYITEPKLKEINQHLSNILTGDIDSTTTLTITSQDSLGNLSQLYNATVNRFTLAAKALRESEERYRTLFEQSPIGVYRTTPNGKFIAANPVLVKMLGYSSFEELSRKTAIHIVPKHEYPRNSFIERIEQEGEIRGFESQIKNRSGSIIFIRENAKAIKDTNGNTLWYEGTIEDITEKKQMEEELFRKERLAILGTMSGGIAHEIRNPLGAIKNSAYFLKLKLSQNEDSKVHKHIQIIDKEIYRANKIITDLLHFSRVKPPNKEKMAFSQLKKLIEESIENISPVDEKLKININIDPELPVVSIDPQHFNQVLNNLITNAIEAMPTGGELDIVVEPFDQGIIVQVKDTGTGIPEEDVEKIFQPLYTTKGHKGIGLGLALSKQLVELNGGSINFDSILDKGTTFSITIPTDIEMAQGAS